MINKSFSVNSDARQITYNYNNNQQVVSVFDKMYDTITKQFKDYSELFFYYTTDSVKVATLQSINKSSITVYPNPFFDKVQIKSSFNLTKDSKIILMNSLGETMHVELENKNDEISIYTNNQPPHHKYN